MFRALEHKPGELVFQGTSVSPFSPGILPYLPAELVDRSYFYPGTSTLMFPTLCVPLHEIFSEKDDLMNPFFWDYTPNAPVFSMTGTRLSLPSSLRAPVGS